MTPGAVKEKKIMVLYFYHPSLILQYPGTGLLTTALGTEEHRSLTCDTSSLLALWPASILSLLSILCVVLYVAVFKQNKWSARHVIATIYP